MQKKLNVKLGEVQETLLIPLFARAEETRRNGIMNDNKAVEIVSRLDYDFDKMKNKPSLKGAVFRTLTYDYLLKELLKENNVATVVELGCGLNTRMSRIGENDLKWFDLDMPDVYDLWKVFFEESDNRKFLPYSAFDKQWVEEVKHSGKPPYIFVSEASTIYFNEADNKILFALLAENFPGCYYLFDTATDYFINNQEKHDTLKMFNARIKWRINHFREIAAWSPRYKQVKEVNFFTDPPPTLKKKIPLMYRIILKIFGLVNKKAVNQYKLNIFQLG